MKKQFSRTIDARGRIYIPNEILDEMCIEPGDMIRIALFEETGVFEKVEVHDIKRPIEYECCCDCCSDCDSCIFDDNSDDFDDEFADNFNNLDELIDPLILLACKNLNIKDFSKFIQYMGIIAGTNSELES